MTIEAHSRRIPYYPALDGVRGVAVAAVLAYHGGVAWARGGFLGVDVFFVLSGFLITSILVAEWQERGSIDFIAFWARRARRLLPALLVVVAVVAVLSPFLLPPDELGRLRGDGLAGLFYVGNWRLVLGGRSYFDQFADPSPLLHLWSLGIEEQWYLVWPLVLAGALRVRERPPTVLVAPEGVRDTPGAPSSATAACPSGPLSGERSRAGLLLLATLVAVAASAALMALLAPDHGDPGRVYYGTDTRAQALLVGAALAFLLGGIGTEGASPGSGQGLVAGRGARWAGVVGAGILVLAFWEARGEARWLYRGGSVGVAVAAAAVIAAAIAPGGPMRRVLGVAPLRAAGRVSYGLYLWHWPVYVALTPARTGIAGAPLLAVRVAVTVAAAALSFRFVEVPVREGRLRDWRAPAAAGVALATVIALVLAFTSGALPFPSPTRTESAAGAAPAPAVRPAGPGGRPRLLLAGDSVAFSLGYHFRPELAAGARLRTSALLGCGVARGRPIVDGAALPQNEGCDRWPQQWRSAVDSFHPDVAVIMVGAWEVFDRRVGGTVLRVGTPEYARYLLGELDTGVRVLAARGAPVAVVDVACFSEPDLALGKPPSPRNEPGRVATVNRVLADLAARTDRVHLVHLSELLCPGGRYVDRIGGVKVRRDGVHFTPEGARLVWAWLSPRLAGLAARPGG